MGPWLVAGPLGASKTAGAMNPLAAHERAQSAFAAVLSAVRPDQLETPTPCTEWSVRDLVAHVIAGNHRVAGSPAPELPDDLPTLIQLHAASARAAQATFAAPGGLEREYVTRMGSMPGTVIVGMRARDALVHAWDLAKATGQPTDIEPELAKEALEVSRQIVTDQLRGPGRPFGPEMRCDPGRPAGDRLAAFLGREVD